MACAHDCRYFIHYRLVKDSNPKKTITCDISIFEAGLVRCSQHALSTSPYESKLASG